MMNQESNFEAVPTTPMRKNQNTVYTESTDEKDLRKFESEKILGMATTVAEWQIKRRIQFSETKDSSTEKDPIIEKRLFKTDCNPEKKDSLHFNKEKQTSIEHLIEYVLQILNIVYSDSYFNEDEKIQPKNRLKLLQLNKDFRFNIIKILKFIRQKPKQLSTHLNKIFYSGSNFRILPFSQIEKQILFEWKQNLLLASIRSEWYKYIQKRLHQFQGQSETIFSQIVFEQFCQFMAQVTYYVFKDYFVVEIEKNNKTQESIKNKLATQTMRYILTQNSEWKRTVIPTFELIVSSKYFRKDFSISVQKKKNLYSSFIQEIKLKPMRQLLQKQLQNDRKLFPETGRAIVKFNKQYFMRLKIKSITNVRVALEQDIIIYQKNLIEEEKITNFKFFEKDQILSCLSLAILSNNISLHSLFLSLKEVRWVLGEGTDKILGIFKCPSYFTDLEVAAGSLKLQFKDDCL